MEKRFRVILCVMFLSMLLFTGQAMGYDFGRDITIPDTVYDPNDTTGSYGSGFVPPNGHWDDHEVEPGTKIGQRWDLEAFFTDCTSLTVFSGFDVVYGEEGSTLGDIFIDIDGDASFGWQNTDPGAAGTAPIYGYNYGYEYVIDLNYTGEDDWGLEYTIYNISDESNLILQAIMLTDNITSNPWQYYSGGYGIYQGTSNLYYFDHDVYNLTGGYHYAIDMPGCLDPIYWDLYQNMGIKPWEGVSFTFHLTMECGNDNLMGAAKCAVPEPVSIVLFGSGLLGLAGLRKRFSKGEKA
jgi:hypothetical protein